MTQYDIYGIGNALVDTEVEVSDAFLEKMQIEKGMMTLVEPERQKELIEALQAHNQFHKRASGGSAANTIIGARYFGAKAYYACKVADDSNGEFYLNDLNAAGVSSNVGGDLEQGTTGTCLVMVTPDAERTMNTYLGISDQLALDELDHGAIIDAKYLYLEGYLVTSPPARAAAIQARQWAEKAGNKTALTFSDPAMVEYFKDGLKEMLGDGVDLLFCNQQEACIFAETDDVEQAVTTLLQIAKTVVITLGSDGATIRTASERTDIAPHSVTAVDTNGAGDMFAGAYLYGITSGLSTEQAGKLASLASAKVVEQFGPRLNADMHAQLLKEAL